MILETIEDFYNGAKEKIAELIDNIKEHFKSLGTGIIISIIAEVFIAVCSLTGLLNQSLENPYTTGLSYSIIFLNLVFALVIPMSLLVNEKFTIVQNIEKLEEKIEMLNSVGNAISYSLGYFSVIAIVYYIFPKYTYLFGITIGNIIAEVLFVVIALLIILKLKS